MPFQLPSYGTAAGGLAMLYGAGGASWGEDFDIVVIEEGSQAPEPHSGPNPPLPNEVGISQHIFTVTLSGFSQPLDH